MTTKWEAYRAAARDAEREAKGATLAYEEAVKTYDVASWAWEEADDETTRAKAWKAWWLADEAKANARARLIACEAKAAALAFSVQ